MACRCCSCLRPVLPIAQLRRRRKLLFSLLLTSTIVYLIVIQPISTSIKAEQQNATEKHVDPCSYKTFELEANSWTGFPLIVPHIEPNISCKERKLFMVVVVNSDANDVRHRDSRAAIRGTWGKPWPGSTLNLSNSSAPNWKLFFSLGLSYDILSTNYHKHEAITYNDIIIGNFNDTYRNIVFKTFMSHVWVFSRFDCKYILKTDDDVYVRVSWVANWLHTNVTYDRFYGGYIEYVAEVWREPGSKWYITEEEYKGKLWPPFAHGSYQVISSDLLPEYFNYTQFRKPFHADDAFFGVAARDLRVKARDIPGFCFITNRISCDLKTATAICHDISPQRMVSLHETHKTLKERVKGYL